MDSPQKTWTRGGADQVAARVAPRQGLDELGDREGTVLVLFAPPPPGDQPEIFVTCKCGASMLLGLEPGEWILWKDKVYLDKQVRELLRCYACSKKLDVNVCLFVETDKPDSPGILQKP